MNILLYNKKVILPSENLTTYQTKFNKYKFRFYNSKFNNLTFIENDNKVQNLNNNQINDFFDLSLCSLGLGQLHLASSCLSWGR